MRFFKHSVERKPSFDLVLVACLLAIFVLALGAFTRLSDAGLGCPDWPTCYGHVLWPKTAEDVQAANLAFPEMQVEHDKTWPEMVHRYLASSLGLVAIFIVFFAWKNRGNNQPLKLPLFLLGFVILQGMFGMWTVTLKLWPQVVTAHLLGGFTTLGLLWLLVLRLGCSDVELSNSKIPAVNRYRWWALIGLIVVFMQIALGGWTTSNYAALACPDLPTCQAQWWPVMSFSQAFDISQSIGPNYLGGIMNNEARTAIHFSHRLGAIIVTFYIMLMGFVFFKNAFDENLKLIIITMIGVLFLQVGLGLSNILFNFPVAIAVAHNLVGAILLLCLITLNYRLFSYKFHVA